MLQRPAREHLSQRAYATSVQRWTIVLFSIASLTIFISRPSTSAASCATTAHTAWTAAEKSVWINSICLGKVANLLGQPEEERKLSSQFLQMILLDDPWRSNIPRQGVRIIGAVFDQPVALDNADIEKVLWLEDCVFNEYVFFSHTRASRLISFDRSTFKKKIHLIGIIVKSSLFMREILAHKRIELWSAEISSNLFFSGSKIAAIFMQLTHVLEDVVLEDAHVNYLQMSESKIGGSISIKSKNGSAAFNKVRLNNVRIGGRLVLKDIQIGTPLQAAFAEIAGSVQILGGVFKGLEMTGTAIGGELKLMSGRNGRIQWSDTAELVLHNASARAIEIFGQQWPPKLDLRGFTYQFIIEAANQKNNGAGSPGSEDVDLYLRWLERSTPWSPQPYHYLAQLLKAKGAEDTSREILFAAAEKERVLARGWRYFLKSLNWLIIGHGYHLNRLFYSIALLLLASTLVIQLSGEARKHKLGLGVSFCLDLLLPVLKLREWHYEIDLRPGVRHYFYFHQIMGYVLASFLIAGLSGLVK